MKHRSTGNCKCHRCAALASGKTPARFAQEYREWAQAQLVKFGWYAHFVPGDDPQTPTGVNFHTHGLKESHDHADFQIVVFLEMETAHGIFANLIDRVKAGEKFQVGQEAKNIIANDLLVTFIDAVECERPVLRVILPDKHGKLKLGEIDAKWADQYKLTEVEAKP